VHLKVTLANRREPQSSHAILLFGLPLTVPLIPVDRLEIALGTLRRTGTAHPQRPEGTVQLQERCAAGLRRGRCKRWYDEGAELRFGTARSERAGPTVRLRFPPGPGGESRANLISCHWAHKAWSRSRISDRDIGWFRGLWRRLRGDRPRSLLGTLCRVAAQAAFTTFRAGRFVNVSGDVTLAHDRAQLRVACRRRDKGRRSGRLGQ